MDRQKCEPAAASRRRWARTRCTRYTLVVLLSMAGAPVIAADWQPISPDELQMTREPAAPQAPAIILYRQVERDDVNHMQSEYVRVKVLTEAGRQYANVELAYSDDSESIGDVQARVVQPDGSIVPFDGRVYDTALAKSRDVHRRVKTITLPDVRVGSIIDYRYVRLLDRYYVFDSRLTFSAELFTKRGRFSLRPNPYYGLRWTWPRGLPSGTVVPEKAVNNRLQFEVSNVPAFIREDFMPPGDEMKYRVEFIYVNTIDNAHDPAAYWRRIGTRRYNEVRRFVDADETMQRALQQIVVPGETAEAKLRKIYARVQQIRNVSWERQRTEQEEQRDEKWRNFTVGDVWKRGYGTSEQITWLFMALARAAGFQADPVDAATRDRYFLNRDLMRYEQLDAHVALVKVGDAEQAFDPGTYLAPYGVLPWAEAGVTGLRLDPNGGQWTNIIAAPASAARIARRAVLELDPDGNLHGHVTVTYSGQEALQRRLEERNEDATARRRHLEDALKASVSVDAEARLTNEPEWTNSAPTLVAEFDMEIPGWAVSAGSRMLLPVAVFGGADRHSFEHATRVNPVYFSYPFAHEDDVEISLPPGVEVSNLPPGNSADNKSTGYLCRAEMRDGRLFLQRHLAVQTIFMDARFYDDLRSFFQGVRAGDEQQVVLARVAGNAAH